MFFLRFFAGYIAFAAAIFVFASERPGQYRNLLLLENRSEALSQLIKDYSLGPWPIDAGAEFKLSQREIGESFLSERAQHLYQVGLSLTYKGDTSAEQSLLGALEIEPENLKILVALAKNYLGRSNCAKAEEIISKLSKNYFLLEEKYILSGQLLVCRNKLVELNEHLIPTQNFLLPHKTYAMILSLRAAEANKDIGLIKSIALELIQLEPQMPESYYWLWKYEVRKNTRKDYGDRYLALCQSISVKEKKRFYLEPVLCSAVDEVRGANEKS